MIVNHSKAIFKNIPRFVFRRYNSRMTEIADKATATSLAHCPKENCIFCGIIKENDENKIIYNKDDIVVFADIKPAAKFHYLVVPKQHIVNAKCLTSDDKELVEKLVRVAENVLQNQNADVSNARFGFHWPPFNTISHLHLHAISPVTDMTFLARMIFKPNSYWFVSPEYVLSKL